MIGHSHLLDDLRAKCSSADDNLPGAPLDEIAFDRSVNFGSPREMWLFQSTRKERVGTFQLYEQPSPDVLFYGHAKTRTFDFELIGQKGPERIDISVYSERLPIGSMTEYPCAALGGLHRLFLRTPDSLLAEILINFDTNAPYRWCRASIVFANGPRLEFSIVPPIGEGLRDVFLVPLDLLLFWSSRWRNRRKSSDLVLPASWPKYPPNECALLFLAALYVRTKIAAHDS